MVMLNDSLPLELKHITNSKLAFAISSQPRGKMYLLHSRILSQHIFIYKPLK